MVYYFFFNDTATADIYTYGHTLSLDDALPICLQDVPLSITVATSDQLKASGIQNLEALNTVVPGLIIAKAQFGAFLPLIRGIGTALNVSENPTALYVDGVLIPDQIGRASCRERVCQYV